MTDWQPIETAPRDGTELLLYGMGWRRGLGYYAKGRHIGWYERGAWSTRDPEVLCVATEWQELPPPPDKLGA